MHELLHVESLNMLKNEYFVRFRHVYPHIADSYFLNALVRVNDQYFRSNELLRLEYS